MGVQLGWRQGAQTFRTAMPSGGLYDAVQRIKLEGAAAEAWDRFVASSPAGDLVQTVVWGRGKQATGFDVALIVCRRGCDTKGGALIVMRRFGPFGALGYVSRGPVLGDGEPETVACVLDAVERVARTERVRHLVIQPPHDGQPLAAALAARGYTAGAPDVAPSATLILNLAPPLDTILARMSSPRRGSVRQALRRGIEVRLGERVDIGAFAELHASTARRQGFAALSCAYLEQQWDALRPQGAIELFLACHEGRPIAGIWITLLGNTLTYRVQGWNGEQPQLQPNVACHWRAIQWAKEHGCRYYDLGGIGRQYVDAVRRGELLLSDPQHSPAAFKVGFGGELVLLPEAWQLTFNPLARPLVRAAYRHLAQSPHLRSFIHRLRNGCATGSAARTSFGRDGA